MTDLQHRQQKMQEKRKNTQWRDFLREIASWQPLVFYKNQGIVSRFPEGNRVTNVVSFKGYEPTTPVINEEKGFFDALQQMFHDARFPALTQFNNAENADYADTVVGSKNVYLSNTVTFGSEDVAYSFGVKDNGKQIFNCRNVYDNSENIYHSYNISASFNVFFSKNIINSNNVFLSTNLIGCTECIACNGLENQSYYINNKQYKKEEYFDIKEKLLREKKNEFEDLYEALNPADMHVNVRNGEGNFLVNVEDAKNTYNSINLSHAHNVVDCGTNDASSDYYDVFICGRSTHFYGVVNSGGFSEHVYCSHNIGRSSFIYYSYFMINCSYCLGCIGLQNKQFCIFNKQYEKEERHKKVNEIFSQMDSNGTLGEFFPAKMNPFYFNDTAAYMIDDSFTKEEVEKLGYLWRDNEVKVDVPENMEVVLTHELEEFEGYDDDGNRTIHPDILKKVIVDETGNYYRIIPMEYKFLKKHGLPLPRKHWLERLKTNFTIGSHGE